MRTIAIPCTILKSSSASSPLQPGAGRKADDRGGAPSSTPPRTARAWKNCAHFAAKRGLEFHAISSATGEGIVRLVRAMADALDRIPKPEPAPSVPEIVYVRRAGCRGIACSAVRGGRPRRRSRRCAPPGGALTSHAAHKTSGGGARAFASRFSEARSIRFTPATSPWRRPRSGGSISTRSISFRRRARRINRNANLLPFVHRYAMVALACADHPAFVPSLAEAPTPGFASHVFYTIRHGPALPSRAPRRSSLFHSGRRPVPGNPHLEELRSAAGCLRFHHRQPSGIPAGRAAPRDSAGKVRPLAGDPTRKKSPCANPKFICSPPSRATSPPPRFASGSNASKASTGLCPRAWRNTFSGRPCTGDTARIFVPKFAGPSKPLRTSKPWTSRC